jgi:hypothetical protein
MNPLNALSDPNQDSVIRRNIYDRSTHGITVDRDRPFFDLAFSLGSRRDQASVFQKLVNPDSVASIVRI